jgi:ATP-dependent 26S proteasome regulatory subunit/ATP-dependent Clp protease adapter protein ClpS
LEDFMADVGADATPVGLVFHNDDKTPAEFVAQLLREVFGRPAREASAVTSAISKDGKAVCGPYPASIAGALVSEVQRRIAVTGHPLRITTERIAQTEPEDEPFKYAWEALEWHFAGMHPEDIVTSVRQFPGHMRADIQLAVDTMFATPDGFFGLRQEYRDELEIAALIGSGRFPPTLVPPQYHAIDIGEDAPIKCLRNGLWLCREGELRYAVLLSRNWDDNKQPVSQIEIAVPDTPEAEAFAQRCFDKLEAAVLTARSYRGKILSFDLDDDYRGRANGIMVHQLPPVAREQVILPERTLKLLDRNVIHFINSRDALRRFGQSTRKGILLYGPPGTGKTHTIRYLATNLRGHTTLIITAAEVAILGAYMTLARLLQPSIVVIEDVDLIARDRGEMDGPCEESMLNRLLNEMDGLKEDADILFVLTTNRPEELEHALAGRPGRIDQAIEVPLPDAAGRNKLVWLYGKGLPLTEAVVDEAVRRTEGVSAAFIKELMRRIAQSSIARDGGNTATSADIDEALDDMLFAGGQLNVKLLGGAQEMAR